MQHDNGKPVERRGRKATGLQALEPRTAGSPNVAALRCALAPPSLTGSSHDHLSWPRLYDALSNTFNRNLHERRSQFFATAAISGTFAVIALVTTALIGEALPGSGIFAENAMLAKAHQERLTSNIFPARPVALVAVKPSLPSLTSIALAESNSPRISR
jgi:hypothetical protein